MKRSYILRTNRGTTSKRFSNLIDAWKFLKKDSPDLEVVDFRKLPIKFADGYVFSRSDIR